MAKVTLDFSGLNKLKKSLREAENVVAEVGHVVPATHPKARMPMAWLGAINHFGGTTTDGKHIPPRPYITNGLYKPKHKESLQQAGSRILNGVSTPLKELRRIAPKVVTSIKRDMGKNTVFEQNAAWTIEVKEGRDTPLVDTGDLRADVNYRIERKPSV